MTKAWIPPAVALATGLLLAPVVREAALRRGVVAGVRSDRWHSEPTPLLGGIGIVAAFLAALASGALAGIGGESSRLALVLGVGGLGVAALGLADDLLRLRPATKFLGQVGVALLPLVLGMSVPGVHPLLGFGLSLFWIVGITNAFNLLDNMDGLSGGVAAISAMMLAAAALQAGAPEIAVMAVSLAFATAGFLRMNFPPARIFMGDVGSMFLGYVLAVLALAGARVGARPVYASLLVPVCVLLIPIFDTTLVTVLRLDAGRSPAQGGRDHTSHRLVALGLSERSAVLTLYSLALVGGGVALTFAALPAAALLVAALVLVLGAYYFGTYLGRVPVYIREPDVVREAGGRGFFVFDAFLPHKAALVDAIADTAVVCASYVGATLLRYEGVLDDGNARLVLVALPVVLVCRLGAFFGFGLYRNVRGTFSTRDVLTIIQAVVVSTVAYVTILLLLTRFAYYSRAVVVIDAVLVSVLVIGARVSLHFFEEVFGLLDRTARRRVLVLGAGELGSALVSVYRRSRSGERWNVVGFLDDSPDKRGRQLANVPVLGPMDDLAAVLQREKPEMVVLCQLEMPEERVAILQAICRERSVEFRRARID